jgi:uncharacterized protein YecE (DUF72 family)
LITIATTNLTPGPLPETGKGARFYCSLIRVHPWFGYLGECIIVMILVGTSGFSYDDWKGPFYPANLSKKDMLSYYARQFNTVEINSTYYAIPSPRSFAAMADNTPDYFTFTVKAHKDITHSQSTSQEAVEAFLRSIHPLEDAGKLGCILVQYPWSFKNTPQNLDRVKALKESIGEIPTVIEFRNSDWIGDAIYDVLRSLGLGFCSVDEPDLKGLMPKVCISTSKIGYVRFHGRNAKDWWKNEQSYQRYDYLYQEHELSEWAPKIQELSENTEKVYIYFNNHYKGKSAANAKMIADLLKVQQPQYIPDQLSLM